MKDFFKKIWASVKSFFLKIQPGDVAWKGAFKAMAATALLFWLIGASFVFVIEPKTFFGLIPIIIGPLLAFLISAGAVLILMILKLLPKKFFWYVPGVFFLTSFLFNSDDLSTKFPLLTILFAGLMGAGLFTILKKSRLQNTLAQNIVSLLGIGLGTFGLVWGLIWLFDTGFKPEVEHINAALKSTYRPKLIDAKNPAEPGNYTVRFLTYGSGKDRHRPEFGEEVDIVTDSIDGSRLIDNWDGFPAKIRTWYWGHDDEALPINGRVWYPEGDGPFPLALIVHGNHSMYDYSDHGYEYLGKLLASQGIIMVSVDENFINGAWSDIFGEGLNEENDARGWLLLEHLRYWRTWNKDSESDFFGKIDMENLAVMGHSRGGEAAAIAGFFNTLDYYPDDAKQKFDFNFNIKSVVAIAPVDGQYKPGETTTPLKDVNYLVLHGANDGDVQSFAGLRQYERVKFSDSTDFYKSAVYVYGANHGQFNTSWGKRDAGMPFGALLNVDALLPMEDQLEIGKVYISAFLQNTLLGKKEYQPLFKDYRHGINWLPKTIYLNQYEESDWQMITDFEEDLDLTTLSDGGSVETHNLTVWKEQLVGMKWGDKGTQAVYIGWDSLACVGDTARFTMNLNEPLDLNETPNLSFELSEARGRTYPDKERDKKEKEKEAKEDESGNNDNAESDNLNVTDESEDSSEKEEDKDEPKAEEPIDFTIELKDSNGNTLSFLLSEYSYLQRQLKVDVLKNTELQSTKTSEAVYNTFSFNLENMLLDQSSIDTKSIISIEFIFEKTKQGLIILDKFFKY